MKDILEDFKRNYFLDESNTGIVKEHYKEKGFEENLLFKIQRNEINENEFHDCFNHIKPLLSNEKLVICNTPVVRYETNVYSVDDNNPIESIIEHLSGGGVVLLFGPTKIDNTLMYKTRFL